MLSHRKLTCKKIKQRRVVRILNTNMAVREITHFDTRKGNSVQQRRPLAMSNNIIVIRGHVQDAPRVGTELFVIARHSAS